MILKIHIILSIVIASVIMIPLVVDAANDNIILFNNIGQYIGFENRMKAQLNMPIVATNYATGEPEPTKQLTTDYTKPIFHENASDRRVIVFIEHRADVAGQVLINKTVAVQSGWNLDVVPP